MDSNFPKFLTLRPLASHVDVPSGSSRVAGQERVTSPKNVCVFATYRYKL